MTKNDPYILCQKCKEFDKSFENGYARLDVLIICNHEPPECDNPIIKTYYRKEDVYEKLEPVNYWLKAATIPLECGAVEPGAKRLDELEEVRE